MLLKCVWILTFGRQVLSSHVTKTVQQSFLFLLGPSSPTRQMRNPSILLRLFLVLVSRLWLVSGVNN